MAAKLCGGAHTSGFPICGFVKVHPELQSHKNVYSRSWRDCGHCSCTEPSSCTEPRLASKDEGEDRRKAIKEKEGKEETESQNVAAEVLGCAHTCGFPICGLVKASRDNQSHKSVHTCGFPTCGRCSCMNPSSCMEPSASVSSKKYVEHSRLVVQPQPHLC